MWMPGTNELITWDDTFISKGKPGYEKHLHDAHILLLTLGWCAVEDGDDPQLSRAYIEARYIVAEAKTRGRINVSAIKRLHKITRKEI